MTIEEKLRKTLQTKTGLKEAINNKGGTITDETPFEEYITQVENLSGGGSSVTYVPVPSEGYVDKIYFNINLTPEEVDTLLDNSGIEWIEGEEVYAILYTGTILLALNRMLLDTGKYAYIISEITSGFIYYSSTTASAETSIEGWHPVVLDTNGEGKVQSTVSPTEGGIPIGTQNDAIKELIYVDKLVDGNGYAEVVSSAEEMEANLTAENKHKFYLYNGEDGQYTNGEYYAVVDDEETVIGAVGGVIEVEELPTEDIDTNSIYKTSMKFIDIYVYSGSNNVQGVISDTVKINGTEILEEKPTDNIVNSTFEGFYLYYITGEHDIFVYLDLGAGLTWCNASLILEFTGYAGLSFIGETTEPDKPKVDGYYAYFKDNWYYKYENNGWLNLNPLQKKINSGEAFGLFSHWLDEALDDYISGLDFSNVTNMNSMFSTCTNLITIPLFDTSSATTMNNMFEICNHLTTIHNLDTSPVRQMVRMFSGCSVLTTIPLLDTSKVTNMNYMFHNCTNLTSVPQLNTSNVTEIDNIFYGCTNLISVPQLNTISVTTMNSMFYNCSRLTSVPLLNTSKVTTMNNMFHGCHSLTSVPQLNTSNVTTMNNMFESCRQLTTIPLLNTSKVTTMSYMFHDCINLTSVPLLDLINVTDTYSMFLGCSALTSLTLINIKANITIGNGTAYGHLLTLDNLINTCRECINVGSTRKLTMGSANTAKIARYYVKLANGATTIESGEKGELEYQEDVGAYYFEDQRDGAISLNEYMALKNWNIA